MCPQEKAGIELQQFLRGSCWLKRVTCYSWTQMPSMAAGKPEAWPDQRSPQYPTPLLVSTQ